MSGRGQDGDREEGCHKPPLQQKTTELNRDLAVNALQSNEYDSFRQCSTVL